MSKMKKFNLISLQKIFNANTHDAFTDLQCVNNILLLCFRRASDHHSKDGVIVLQKRTSLGKLLDERVFSLANTDLRDPRIHVVNGKLRYVSAYAKRYVQSTVCANTKKNEFQQEPLVHHISENVFWEHITDSKNAHSIDQDTVNIQHWDDKGKFAEPYHWCWRTRWHKNMAYSLAYKRSEDSLFLYQGKSLKVFEHPISRVLSLEEHGLGYPNESDLVFLPGNRVLAITRRDADSFTTQLGMSDINEDGMIAKWDWQSLAVYLASPCLYLLDQHRVLVAARYEHSGFTPLNEAHKTLFQYFGNDEEFAPYKEGDLKTGLFILNVDTEQLEFLSPLPSAGDNGYPGITSSENKLFVSYYSSAEQCQPQVYLCEVDI